MPRFRKKPIVIEAIQWFKDGDHPAVKRIPIELVNGCWAVDQIETLEGPMNVIPGDWIITGVEGEHYPCKPDIFEASYELAGDEQDDI